MSNLKRSLDSNVPDSARCKIIEDRFVEFHDKQKAFVNDQARYTVCEAGTKSGKTLGCAIWIVRCALKDPGTLWWWIAPTYIQAGIAFDLILNGDRMISAVNE